MRQVLATSIFISLIFINACKNRERSETKQPVPEEDTVSLVEQDSLLLELKQNEDIFSDWQKFYDQQAPGFSLDSFAFDYADSISQIPARAMELNAAFYRKYGTLLVYNDDSTHFIDPFSYYIVIKEKNGRLVAGGTEADQEVAIVNPKTNMRQRIFYCGPACFIAKASWLDDSKIVLLGTADEAGNGNYIPTIWIVDIHAGLLRQYSNNKQGLPFSKEDYLDQMLRSKGIE